MKHFVSMSNFCFLMNADEVFVWAGENNFDGIEIWAEVPFWYSKEVNKNMLKRISGSIEDLEISVHAPFYGVNISAVNPGILNESLSQIKVIFEWKDFLPIKNIIVHLGKTPSQTEDVMKVARKIAVDSLVYLKKYADKYGLELLVENVGIDHSDMDMNTGELLNIVEELNMNICLDTGHANIAWPPGTETLERVSSRIKQMHISDNDGISDQHLSAGEGNINWKIYKNIFSDNSMPLVHEINYNQNPLVATLKSREKINNILNCFT